VSKLRTLNNLKAWSLLLICLHVFPLPWPEVCPLQQKAVRFPLASLLKTSKPINVMSSIKDLSPLVIYSLGALFALLMFAFGAATAWMADHGYFQLPLLAAETDATSAPPPLLTDVFREAWQVVETDFYGQMPTVTERTYGAIKGSLATLDDPNT